MATLDEVKTALADSFPGANLDAVQEQGHRVLGAIVWEGFRDMDIGERNRRVTRGVRDRIGVRALNVGILFPLAPGEIL